MNPKAESRTKPILVRKLGQKSSCYTLLAPQEVAVVFVGETLFKELIEGHVVSAPVFKSHNIYICTQSGNYYTSAQRSLKALCTRLQTGQFFHIQQGLAVNIRNVREVDFQERLVALSLSGRHLLWLSASRRQMKDFRAALFEDLIPDELEDAMGNK